jgi:hypothetical protein
MEKITDYHVAVGLIETYANDAKETLSTLVNHKITEGYEPFGSVFTVRDESKSVLAFQPMVKRER